MKNEKCSMEVIKPCKNAIVEGLRFYGRQHAKILSKIYGLVDLVIICNSNTPSY